MARTMPPWKPEQEMSMNMRVFKTLAELEQVTKVTSKSFIPIFLVAIGDTFCILVRNKLAWKDLTRTDLKNVSRLSSKLAMELAIDLHQPIKSGTFIDIDSQTLETELIKIKELRKIL